MFTNQNNTSPERELRRYENRLISIGTGIAAFGIWSVIRFIMTLMLDTEETFKRLDFGIDSASEMIVFLIITFIVLLLLFLAHLHIGISARKEGLGGRGKWGYLIFTVIFLLFYLWAVSEDVRNMDEYYNGFFDCIIETAIDCTVTITLVEILYAAITVRCLRRKLSNGGT